MGQSLWSSHGTEPDARPPRAGSPTRDDASATPAAARGSPRARVPTAVFHPAGVPPTEQYTRPPPPRAGRVALATQLRKFKDDSARPPVPPDVLMRHLNQLPPDQLLEYSLDHWDSKHRRDELVTIIVDQLGLDIWVWLRNRFEHVTGVAAAVRSELVAVVTLGVSGLTFQRFDPRDLADLAWSFAVAYEFHLARSGLIALLREYKDSIRQRCSDASPNALQGWDALCRQILGVEMHLPFDRHDNDFADITRVSVLPTADELRSTREPHLPMPPHPGQPEVNMQALLDRHFRLLRQNLVGQVQEELKQPALTLRQVRINISGLCQREEKQGPHTLALQVNFQYTDPTLLKRLDSLETEAELRHYAETSTRLLPDGALVVLREPPTVAQEQQGAIIAVGVVKIRDAGKILVRRIVSHEQQPRGRGRGRGRGPPPAPVLATEVPRYRYEGSVGVVFGPQDVMHMRSCNGGLPQNLVMIPTTVQVFAVQHVLEMLKTLRHEPIEAALTRYQLPRTCKLTIPPELKDGLDEFQRAAIEQCETQVLSLIQGPPGCGKTFVGVRLVLHFAKIGKRVLLLTYTNHALDQFLLKIADAGIDKSKMLRLGSQHRDEKIEPMLARKKVASTKERGICATVLYRQRDELCDTIRDLVSDERAVEVIAKCEPDFASMRLADEEVKEFRDRSPDRDDVTSTTLLRLWLAGTTTDPDAFHCSGSVQTQEARRRLFQLPLEARNALWNRRGELSPEAARDFAEAYEALLQKDESIRRHKQRSVANLCRDHDVIGCTTSFAAMNPGALRDAKIDVVIVEETAEILEHHVLASLPPENVFRIICIGDHQQLRPKIDQYRLQVESGHGYNLDVSVFERLIVNGYPSKCLGKQQRMFPALGAVMRKLAYPTIIDGDKVCADGVAIPGLAVQLAFVGHAEQQDRPMDTLESTSHTNSYEAGMIARTVKHLVSQAGVVKPSQIVVLTMYLGQVSIIRQQIHSYGINIAPSSGTKPETTARRPAEEAARSSEDDSRSEELDKEEGTSVRVSTVDNFQGEEADYVLVSLVRGNPQNTIGFTKSIERVTVMLSRARRGLIIFGNANVFRNASPMWRELIVPHHASRPGDGTLPWYEKGLRLQCRHHKASRAYVSTVDAFDAASPEGGCNRACGVLMSCREHRCPRRCHADDANHMETRCEACCLAECSHGHFLEDVPCWMRAEPTEINERCAVCRYIRDTRAEADRAQAAFDLKKRQRSNETAKRLAELQKRISTANAAHEHALANLAEGAAKDEEALTRAHAASISAARAEISRANRCLTEANALEEAAFAAQVTASRCTEELERGRLAEEAQRRRAELGAQTRLRLDEIRRDFDREVAKQNAAARAVESATATTMTECAVCFTEAAIGVTRTCTNAQGCAHVVCKECMLHYIDSHCIDNLSKRAAGVEAVILPCPMCADAGGWSIRHLSDLSLFLRDAPNTPIDRLVKAFQEVCEKRGQQQAEAEQRRKDAEGEVARHWNTIVEDILTLKCPRCRAAFTDFSDCFAITCACRCSFCAWCLADCGADSHAHVVACPQNPRKGKIADSVSNFNRHQNDRRHRLASEYARTKPCLSQAVRDQLLQRVTRHFAQSGHR